MNQTSLPGDPPVAVTLRRSARARRLSLRVSRLDGRVTLTMPTRAPLQEGMSFLEEKADWIRQHLSEQPDVIVPATGHVVTFEGREHQLVASSRRSAKVVGDVIEVPNTPSRVAVSVKSLFKAAARDRLAAACDDYTARIGREMGRLTLRDTRSRWGSCTANGDLMFSWRLIMAPPEVLRYVAAHEVAHLQEMNHSAAFWAIVDELYPGYQIPRRWLRDNGETLHRLRFDA